MFHGKHFERAVTRAGERAGLYLTGSQIDLLGVYAGWLVTEGVAAGGIGPGEEERVTDRHIADSLVFGAAWETRPRDVLDVGSGVGLPGIPLAIAYPDTPVVLLDRSGERCRLARRAIRVLGLDNASVVQGDPERAPTGRDVIVFRASLPPERALRASVPLLAPEGIAVVAVSRTAGPPTIPAIPDAAMDVGIFEIEEGVLDSPAWFLRMKRVDSPK